MCCERPVLLRRSPPGSSFPRKREPGVFAFDSSPRRKSLGSRSRGNDGEERGAVRSEERARPPRLRRAVHGRQRLRRSEEHTSELQSLMRISYAVFCLKKKKQ